jgi:hypothetical protein
MPSSGVYDVLLFIFLKERWKRAKYNRVQEKATKTAKQIPSGI